MMDLRVRVIFWDDDLREYCIKRNLFTCGNNEQYEQIFENAKAFNRCQDLSIFVDVARTIWICSSEESLTDYDNCEVLAKDIFMKCTTSVLE